MLIDSHCHLHDRQFFTEEQAEEMLKRARERGVLKIVCIGTDPKDSMVACEFAGSHDGVYWTYGVHPEEANNISGQVSQVAGWVLPTARKNASISGRVLPTSLPPNFCKPKIWGSPSEVVTRPENEGTCPVMDEEATDTGESCHETGRTCPVFDGTRPVAIGEVGLDYHTDGYDRVAQIRLFEEMLQLAKDQELPVVFHVRNAFEDFFPVVANFPGVKGVVHSFTDSKKTLRKILETTDFYVGVNGIATYSTLPTPPLERIMLETDAPFLTPEPFRGIINEPGHILEIAQWLGKKLDVDLETIERETTKNASRLYHLPDTEAGASPVAG